MSDTLIKQDFRPRQLGGGLLLIMAVPLTLLAILLGSASTFEMADIGFLLPGPVLLAAGLWAVFPRHPPKTMLTISDETLHINVSDKVLALDDLTQIRAYVPVLAKHTRLIFRTAQDDTRFDVVHVTHHAQDIINLVGVRLEKQSKFLREGRTDVLGARDGIWTVQQGLPFETGPIRAKNTNGREQTPTKR